MRRFVLILTTALLASACSRDPNVLKKKYLEAGNRYFDKQRYREASIMYRTALRNDPRYGEAHYRNALAMLRSNRYTDAEGSLRRAVELLPEGSERMASRVQLADVYLAYLDAVKRDRLVIEEVDRLCDAILRQDPRSFDGHRLRGTLFNFKAAELSGKYPDDAKAALRDAIVDLRAADAMQPYKLEVVGALTRALWANDQPEEAEKYLKGLLKAQPAFAGGYLELNRFYTKNNRLKEAEETLKSAAVNVPQRPEFLAELAKLYLSAGRRDDMGRTIERLKAQAANSPTAYELAGKLFLSASQPEQAIREFDEGVRKFPDHKIAFQKLKFDALVGQNKNTEAIKLNDEILRDHPDDADALSRQADYWLQNGDAPKAIASFEAILRRFPDHAQTRYNMGRAMLAAGRTGDARLQFTEAIRWAPDFLAARIALIKVQIGTGEYGNAVASADDVLARDGKFGEARVLRAIALRGLGKLDEARAEVKTLLGMYPAYHEALFQLGAVEAAQRNWKAAETAYRKSYQANPASVEGLLALVDLKMEHKEADSALELLREEVKKRPERVDLRLIHGSMASRAGRTPEAEAEFKLLLTKLDNNPKALGDINLRLGEMYFRLGDVQRSLPYLEKARQLRPDDPDTLHSLGVVYDTIGRQKEAAALYESSLKLNGHNPVVMNNLAYYISQNGGDLDQALTFAQRARQSSPDVLAYADTVAFIYLKKNLVENALEILENLVSKSPKDPVFRAHLGEALLKKGETARGRKELQAALSAKPAPAEAARIKELLGKHGG